MNDEIASPIGEEEETTRKSKKTTTAFSSVAKTFFDRKNIFLFFFFYSSSSFLLLINPEFFTHKNFFHRALSFLSLLSLFFRRRALFWSVFLLFRRYSKVLCVCFSELELFLLCE